MGAVSLPVPLQGPPPHRECAPALDTQLLRTRFGWSKLAILLLPNTLFPMHTAMPVLALRTLPPLVQPRPSKVRPSFQLFSPARTCLPTLLLRQTLVDAPTRLVQLRLLPGTVVRPSSKFAQRPLLYWELLLETARIRSRSSRTGCFPLPEFLFTF